MIGTIMRFDGLFSHLDAVRALAFHPTEMCLATGGDDCTVKIWRMDMVGLASPAFVISNNHTLFHDPYMFIRQSPNSDRY